MNKDNLSGIGLGLVIGIIFGSMVGVLYAPKSGKETRTIIKEKVKSVGKKVKVKAKYMRDKYGKFIKRGK